MLSTLTSYTSQFLFRLSSILAFIPFFSSTLFSQTIENVKATTDQDIIIVTYDLIDDDANKPFTVYLHISKDDFTYPVRMVRGDVGPGVNPGQGKRIEWLAKQELGTYKGELIMEVRAVPPAPTYKPINALALSKSKYKAGKQMLIQWEDGKPQTDVTINLLKNDVKWKTIAKVKNESQFYKYKVPVGEKSAYYKIQLVTDESSSTTNPFAIAKKLPVGLILGGAGVVIAGTAAVLLLGGGSDEPGTLPSAPEPN
jgi:hypothetical protein